MSTEWTCQGCARIVELIGTTIPKHTTATWTLDLCPHSGRKVSFLDRQPPRGPNGDGAKGTAPCGHPGTFVTSRMVLCDNAWCDGNPPGGQVAFDFWSCKHAVRVTQHGTTTCRGCGQVFK